MAVALDAALGRDPLVFKVSAWCGSVSIKAGNLAFVIVFCNGCICLTEVEI